METLPNLQVTDQTSDFQSKLGRVDSYSLSQNRFRSDFGLPIKAGSHRFGLDQAFAFQSKLGLTDRASAFQSKLGLTGSYSLSQNRFGLDRASAFSSKLDLIGLYSLSQNRLSLDRASTFQSKLGLTTFCSLSRSRVMAAWKYVMGNRPYRVRKYLPGYSRLVHELSMALFFILLLVQQLKKTSFPEGLSL
ncbi:uncharacterized protein G2W53_027171 [Senna tora]|uniref:Uncharacterized protein n=1 Tax=Senna tora TaxID=362788 RepID=A0A834TIG0_9FABA|nr:uncharacterized protein G2W53_027171 [Senna tora]